MMADAILPARTQRDWDCLSDDQQIDLAQEALRRAARAIAGQAECLAAEIERGTLADQGGADALRLLAALVRTSGDDVTPAARNA